MRVWRRGAVALSLSIIGAMVAQPQAAAPKAATPAATEPAASPAAAAGAGDKQTAKGQTEKEKRERKPVDFQGKTARVDLEKEIYYLTGNVVFTQEKTKLYCDRAEYNAKDNTAKATGNLRIVDENERATTVTGEVINADFDQELAVISGNVTLLTQKKGEAPEDATRREKEEHKKTILTCDKIEYYYDEGRAVATGNLKIVHDDKTITGEVGVYLEKDEVATITGNVRLVDDKGRTMECPKVVVSTAEDWVEFPEGVKGTWWKTEEEEKPAAQTPAERSPAPAEATAPTEPEQPPSATTPTEKQQ